MTLAPVGGFVAGWMVAQGSLDISAQDLRGTLAMVALAVGALAYNGYEDRTIDAGKDTRFALEHPGAARATAGFGYAVTLALATTLGPTASTGFVVLIVVSLLYSRVFVYVPGIKNLAAAGMSAGFVWLGGVASGVASARLAAAAATAFLGILAMVLVEDIEDQPVDRGRRTTLPMVLSPKLVKFLVLSSAIAGVLVLLRLAQPTAVFWIPFFLAAGAFLGSALLLPSRRPTPPPTVSRWLVWNGLWAGLIAMVAGSLARG